MSVRRAGREVRPTRKEFALLAALFESAGRAATRKFAAGRRVSYSSPQT